ncbi:MAG: hypothetical protein ACWA41_03880 [Putridiphycobacter sp.]
MNNQWVKYGVVFVLVILIQVLVLNHFEISHYIYLMIYPMVILLLPIDTNKFLLVGLSILLGVLVDAFSDTFGLHTSSIIVVAYLRPIVLSFIRPRDGYDKVNLPTIHEMGKLWFAEYVLLLLFIHHFWFFSFEVFRLDYLGIILLKTIISTLLSFVIIVILQYLFYKPLKQ